MSEGWAVLVKAALLGTERTGRAAVRATGQVGVLVDVVAAPEERPAERVLLATAAVVATARRAGRRPDHPAVELPPPAPPVDRPPAGEDASRTLGALLSGTARHLLPEWLEACGSTGRRIPAAWLPAVLEAATSARALRPATVAALGGRGRWLAAQRPEWRWAVGAAAGVVPDDPAAAWREGTGIERRAVLAAVRAHDPELGRSLVVSTWNEDRVDDRAAFVGLLEQGLSMDDEPFLEEQARADRGREVRRAAAMILSRLPASRLAARMAERAAAHVALAGSKLSARLPDELPPEWEADGVERQPRRGEGERSWWLAQLVASTPLDRWGQPTEAVAAVAKAELGEAVLRGWMLAASRQHRADWAAALLGAPAPALPEDGRRSLLVVLDRPARAAWLAAALERAPRQGAAPYLGLAGHVPRPWPPALVRAVAGRAAAALLSSVPAAHAARPALELLAERAEPSTLERLAADLASAMQADRRLDAELRRPLALIQLRRDLLAELAVSAPPASPSPE